MNIKIPLLCLTILFVGSAIAGTGTLLEFGGDVRVRGYALENMWDADSSTDGDRWSLLRQRTRLFVRADLDDGVTGFVRIANQHWGEGVTYPDAWEADNKGNKLFVDAAWIEAADLFDLPVDLRLGRQAVIYGTGFVLFDGQSQTASTSIYMDGLRARVDVAPHTALDLLHFKDQENVRPDTADDDITLTGAYLSRKSGGTQECYALRREDQALERDVVTFGLRLAGKLASHLDYDLEGAVQGGDAGPGRSQDAWGLKTEVGLSLPALPASPRPFIGFVGLSGDDPATPASERWDVMYGGWPQFGDLLAWTHLNLGPGNAVAGLDPDYAAGSSTIGEVVYGNLLMPTVGVAFAPADDLDLELSFAPLRFHRAPGTSDDLGSYWQLQVRHRYSDNLWLGIYAAVLDPGEAYGSDADTIRELFWDATLTF